MKKFCIIALTLVLTAALLTGCRNQNQPMETTRPTMAPTTQATTVPTTEATRPSTEATQPSETVDHGNGPLDGTNSTEGMGGAGNSEGMGSSGSYGASVSEGRSTRSMPKN